MTRVSLRAARLAARLIAESQRTPQSRNCDDAKCDDPACREARECACEFPSLSLPCPSDEPVCGPCGRTFDRCACPENAEVTR